MIDIELGDFSRCQIKPKKFSRVHAVEIEVQEAANKKIEDSQSGEKIYGESCTNCSGTNLVRNGTCKVCLDCGSTTGCS